MSWLSDDALARLRAAASAPDLSGTRYRLLGEAGRGGMCTVFLAEDVTLLRRVALKVLDVPDDTGELAERLSREAKVLARLEHPGVVPVHDVGRLADGRVFYAMKLVDGPRLDAFAASGATLHERLRSFQRIVETVAFAHDRGVLHRDLKPENVMVGPFGEVLVMDWGLAKAMAGGRDDARGGSRLETGPHTGHGAILGTPGYMAPEQARGDVGELDARTDVYALGGILRDLLAGAAPAPKPLVAVCAKAMAEDRGDRYPSALALGAEVARFLDGDPVTAYPENAFQKAARVYGRHRVAFWLIATYVIVRGSILFFSRR
jgi:serine/threonine-protein kinase